MNFLLAINTKQLIILICLLQCCNIHVLYCQDLYAGFNASIDLFGKYQRQDRVGLRLSAATGYIYKINEFSILASYAISIYDNQFGVSLLNNAYKVDNKVTLGMTIGHGEYNKRRLVSFNPYFHEPLHTSQNFGIGLFTHLILNNWDCQRVGSLNLHYNFFQFAYYNDGPIFAYDKFKIIADKKDRYWTGGGGIYLTDGDSKYISHIALYFDKYTGFIPEAYKFSNKFQLEEVPYNDPNESSKNTGRFSFSIGFEKTYALDVHLNDFKELDIQEYIHRSISHNPYHPMFRKPHVNISLGAQTN